jgi:predicted glycosyltransferase
MRVLVDVSHPAHVHLFRNAVAAFRERGHAVRVASRRKDVTTDLLDAHGVPHTPISRKRPGVVGLAREWVGRELRLFRLAREFGPDVVLSRLNPAAAHVSRLLGVPNVVFHDTEVAGVVDRVTSPFATVVCTPTEYDGEFGPAHLRYAGFHELAYLHPARFDPDPEPLRAAGVDPDAPYAVVRLVEMTAHHDAGADGLSRPAVRRLVDGLSERGDVYVTAEGPLPAPLRSHAAPVSPAAMHHLLAFADVYVGDSSTMATEAAVLGTPAVRYDPLESSMGNFAALSAYGLVDSTHDEDAAVERALSLAAADDAGDRWRRRRRRLLAEKVDVTAFMTELVTEVADR